MLNVRIVTANYVSTSTDEFQIRVLIFNVSIKIMYEVAQVMQTSTEDFLYNSHSSALVLKAERSTLAGPCAHIT